MRISVRLANGSSAFGRYLLAGVLSLAVSLPAWAEREDEPGAMAMAGDLVVARPIGAAITAVGAAVFIVSLPFTAAGGNVKKAADALVTRPARETFVRCLGCKSAGRYVDPDG